MTLYKMVLKLEPLCVCVCVCTNGCTHPSPQKDNAGVQFEKSLLGREGKSVCWLLELGWAWEVEVGHP